ncbi:MAG TPA: PDZ domain-containing protein [Phycisphaerae bacterium]|nr:PDZ domain-containing protein [Phycisphaerae bacterium]
MRRLTLWMLLGCCVGLARSPALADPPPPVDPSSLSRVVPASAGVFIELQRPRQSDAQLRRADLWTLVQLLSGGETPFDWRALVRRYLGFNPETALANVFGLRVAFAAPDWGSLGEAVIVAELKKPALLAPVVAPRRAVEIRRHHGVIVHRTIAGLWVASNQREAAFSLKAGPGSMFDGVVDLLAEGSSPPLGKDPQFLRQMARFDRGYMGCLYFSGREGATGTLAQTLDPFERGAVGMYLRRDRLDFEIQATLRQPRQRVQRPNVDVERLERLPDSTLLAWAASADLGAAVHSVTEGDLAPEARPYVSFIQALVDLEALEQDVIAKIGPRFILAWDRLRGTSDAPQLAILMESSDAEGVVEAVVDQLATMVATLRRITMLGIAPGPDDLPDPVEESRHLETRILTVTLSGMVPDAGRHSLAQVLLSAVKPSFATLGGWVVAASSPEQVRQIIDAYQGWIPTLGSSTVLRGGRWPHVGDPVVLAAGQPAMASTIVASWEQSKDPTSPWAYEQLFGRRPQRPSRPPRQTLGIGIRRDSESGGAMVARVYAKGPADGRLEVDDRILGVDGKLLSLDSPAADLRQRIAECSDPSKLTLRVRRGEQVLDVQVPIKRPAPPVSDAATDPANALRQLQALGRGLSSAVYTAVQSPADEFHACVSLQLVPLPSHREPAPTRQRRSPVVAPQSGNP